MSHPFGAGQERLEMRHGEGIELDHGWVHRDAGRMDERTVELSSFDGSAV